MDSEDPRCCGGGACIIDDEGRCWCGQVWDGEKMCMPALQLGAAPAPSADTVNSLPTPHPPLSPKA
jgi:hypothetical protein